LDESSAAPRETVADDAAETPQVRWLAAKDTMLGRFAPVSNEKHRGSGNDREGGEDEPRAQQVSDRLLDPVVVPSQWRVHHFQSLLVTPL
jgi:hypothetical protein